MQNMEQWYYENKTLPKLKNKQEWERLSRQAKDTKLTNRKSKRDIAREERIGNLGGETLEITYGVPLSDDERQTRLEVEYDLKYPNRHVKKVYKNKVVPRGKDRSEDDYKKDLLKGMQSRARTYGIPMDVTIDDIVITDLCPIFGTPMFWGDTLTNDNPTVDRVVPALGYVKGNICVISHRANRQKNSSTLEELKMILAYMEGF